VSTQSLSLVAISLGIVSQAISLFAIFRTFIVRVVEPGPRKDEHDELIAVLERIAAAMETSVGR